MKRRAIFWGIVFAAGIMFGFGNPVADLNAQSADEGKSAKSDDAKKAEDVKKDEDKKKPFKEFAPDATSVPGLIPMFRKKDNLYAEISGSLLNTDYIIVISIAKGIGSTALYTGQTWDYFSDGDMVWQFRKVDDRIQIVRRNYRFQAESGTPEEKAVKLGFSDSILYSLPIVAAGNSGGDVVDLTGIFMSDMAGIGRYALPGFSFARDRSTWAKVTGLKDNMEIEVAATYAGSGGSATGIDNLVLDPRGVTVNIHYSISKLPSSGYTPRLADERVGYFNTVVKNFSKNPDDGNFVRYINRWNLQKLEASADQSLPKKPIVFWLEKTIPYQYRKPIRDGILEWNKAFEEAGFYNAVEVRQQEDNDTWDPEDINYNTIRWSTASMGFAIGPSRVNPLTGEILDADVVLDVGFINSWNREFELLSPSDLAKQFFRRGAASVSAENAFPTSETEPAADFIPVINERLYRSQQMGLASTFFDVMTAWQANPSLRFDAEENRADGGSKEADASKEKEKKEETASDEKKDEKTDEKSDKKKEEKKNDGTSSDKKDQKEEKDDAKKSDKKDDSEKKDEPKICEKCGGLIVDSKEEKKEEEKEEKKDDSEKKDEPKICECEKKPEGPNYEEERKKMIYQGLHWLSTHEVGHTLGLRHNFKLSTLYTLEEINDAEKTAEYGYAGSVMEYLPINLMPEGEKQGDYYPTKLGKYDYWVIKYGYKTFAGGTDGEKKELEKIAAEQTKPEYNYAEDYDCYLNSDPLINIFDLGKSPLEYSKLQVRLFKQILPGLDERIVKDGESYAKLRTRFNILFSSYGEAMYNASRYVGGLHLHRDFKGDPDARPPFVAVKAAEQRAAVDFICAELFGKDNYRFSPELMNALAPNRWLHWGSRIPSRYDIDIHEMVLVWQQMLLGELFSEEKLSRMADAELRVAPDEDVYTIAEMFDALSNAVFAELDGLDKGNFTPQKPAVTSLRRNLQREYYSQLAGMALQKQFGFSLSSLSRPSNDISSLARLELEKIQRRIDSALKGEAKLDANSLAHLTELKARIEKVLQASVERSY